MKRLLISAAVASAALLSIPTAANAQAWVGINQRQANLDRRIDQGVRSGELTRREAIILRGDFRTLVNLEARYRRTRGGLDGRERSDLNRRFNVLSARVYGNKHDRQDRPGGGWLSINQRQANLDRRIDQGVRSGELTRREAIILRGEFRTLVRLEAQYRRSGGGFTARERTDLDRRFDRLSARVARNKHDRQDR